METVVVERRFEVPRDFEPLQAAEAFVAWCLKQHGVRFLRSYQSLDRLRVLCLYEAPDVESVRTIQRRGGLPFERVWSAEVTCSCPRAAAREGRSTVIVERELPQVFSLSSVSAMMAAGMPCLALHRAEHLASYLAHDGRRLVCVFDALDVDGLRAANRTMGVPMDRAWPARLHDAASP